MRHPEHHFMQRVGWLRAAVLGALAGVAGGASVGRATARVAFWGALAMAITAGVGYLFGVAA